MIFLNLRYRLRKVFRWLFQKFVFRSSYSRCSIKNIFLTFQQNSQENTFVGVSFLTKLQASGLIIKNKTTTQLFSYEFCKIFKNTFFTVYLRATASVICITTMISVNIFTVLLNQTTHLDLVNINY